MFSEPVFHSERYLASDWWEGVRGGWCLASRNRVRLCWLCTLLAWARNRGIRSGLEKQLSLLMLLLCPGGQGISTEARPCWGGLGEGPAQLRRRSTLEDTSQQQATGNHTGLTMCTLHQDSSLSNQMFNKQMKNVLLYLLRVHSIASWKP